MATALCPCLGLGLGPEALATFFHFKTGEEEVEAEAAAAAAAAAVVVPAPVDEGEDNIVGGSCPGFVFLRSSLSLSVGWRLSLLFSSSAVFVLRSPGKETERAERAGWNRQKGKGKDKQGKDGGHG